MPNMKGYEAYCNLVPGLKSSISSFSLYSNVDGMGSDQNKSVAYFKAISEAMERWAFYSLTSSQHRNDFGFDIDSTSSGFAAFPGFTKRPAAYYARLEALERWALVSWWFGLLPVPLVGMVK